MKIGIVSDTHGDYRSWELIFNNYFHDIDYLIHAGDVFYGGENPRQLADSIKDLSIPIIIAEGNCDRMPESRGYGLSFCSPYYSLELNGKRITVTHGDRHKDIEKKIILGKHEHADILISGHTHIPELAEACGILLLNPGSPSLPKGKNIPTVMLWENNAIRLINTKTDQIIIDYKLESTGYKT